jgi:hypothetical protein
MPKVVTFIQIVSAINMCRKYIGVKGMDDFKKVKGSERVYFFSWLPLGGIFY